MNDEPERVREACYRAREILRSIVTDEQMPALVAGHLMAALAKLTAADKAIDEWKKRER